MTHHFFFRNFFDSEFIWPDESKSDIYKELMSAPRRGLVLAVLDGNTLIVKYVDDSRKPIEALSLDFVQSPRLSGKEEPNAYPAFDFTRRLTLGKRVVVYCHPGNKDNKRTHPNFGSLVVQYGRAELFDKGNMDVGMAVVEAGWGKVREGKNQDDYAQSLLGLQVEAQTEKRGIWAEGEGFVRNVKKNDEVDKKEYLKKKQFDNAIVEVVSNGSAFNILVQENETDFAQISVVLAGIKCRSAFHGNPEQFGPEAKQFVESRLLQRRVNVTLVGESERGFVALVMHPQGGDIAPLLLKEGLAEIFNPTISLVPNAEEYRKLEIEAKKARKNMWIKFDLSALRTGRVDGKVVDLKGSSCIEIETESGRIEKVFFSNCKIPSFNPTGTTEPLGFEAREFVRRQTIGQNVTAIIDYTTASSADPKNRLCFATVYVGNKCINELICKEGLAKVFVSKSQNPSEQIDSMQRCMDEAQKAKKGLFADRLPSPKIFNDCSNKPTRANSLKYLHFIQNKNVKGVIEYFASASRAVVLIPDDNLIIRMNLLGVMGTDPQERIGDEALQFSKKRFLLRDCEVCIKDLDKFGVFTGTLNVRENRHEYSVEVELVRRGYADLHPSSFKHPLKEELNEVLNDAKASKVGMWADETKISTTLRPEKIYEVVVKDAWDPVTLVIQIQSEELDKINKSIITARTPVSKVMKGDLVVAIWERKLYRARVIEVVDSKHVKVDFIELLVNDIVPISDLRVIPESLTKIPPQCMSVRLGGCKNIKAGDAFTEEAIDYVLSLAEDQILYAHLMCDDPFNPDPDVLLTDRPDINGGSVNSMVLTKGYAKFNPISVPERFDGIMDKFDTIEQAAKEKHVGAWLHGNVGDSDDEYDE